jgi:hypothetical protein
MTKGSSRDIHCDKGIFEQLIDLSQEREDTPRTKSQAVRKIRTGAQEVEMNRTLLNVMVWLLFLGGVVGFGMALLRLFGGASPSEYGVLGIGGGFWFLASAVTIFISEKTA